MKKIMDARLPSPNELLDWLVTNQFLTDSRARLFHTPPAAYTDTMALAKDLLQRNFLTPFQINQILQGKGEDLILGPYRVIERLGEGAMGHVVKCWSLKLQLLVAVKMIHKEHLVSKKALDRFFREMETAGKLDHQNIVLLRDADRIGACPFMVMEFVEGTDLSRLVKQNGPLPIWEAADFARQTALGLQHAFERGVVHRDIKPGNLLLTRASQPVVKISDFGLARLESERSAQRRLTQHGAVLGTIDYIAPEQAENAQNADVRSDIYSLGCTLYFLLTGKPPFPGSTVMEKVSARISGEPIDIRTLRPEIPSGLIAILKRMTARHRRERYQTPREVAVALEPFCNALDPANGLPVRQRADVAPARPVRAVAKDPFSFSNTDAKPKRAPLTKGGMGRGRLTAKKRTFVLFALIGGGVALLLALWLSLRGSGSKVAADVYPASAVLAITLKEPDRTLKLGDRKTVIVTIKRTHFHGKVQVSLENVPDGVGPTPNKITIEANKEQGELPIVVYQFAKKETSRIRVRAVAKNLQAHDWLRLTIAGPEALDD